MNLLQEAFEATILIQNPLRDCEDAKSKAKREWLAFWGISMEIAGVLEYPPRWI